MSLEHSPARAQNAAINDPSYTVDEFCAAERMSRSMLYKAWAEGWGPDFYCVGVTRRITHRGRLEWQRHRASGYGDFAKARAHCSGENSFRWRGHLDKLLPKRAQLTRGHHKAMPFADVPAFVGRLREMQGNAPRALEFAILTAARSREVLGASWDEINLRAKVWTVPGERMKASRL